MHRSVHRAGRAVAVAALAALQLASPVLAQGAPRAGDTVYDVAGLSDALAGRTLVFFDDSRAIYHSDGRYEYIYADGDPPFQGTYRVTDGSAVCVDFENGFARCDTIVGAGGRLVLITAKGVRFPVRSREPLAD